jgi:hypothetical protein
VGTLAGVTIGRRRRAPVTVMLGSAHTPYLAVAPAIAKPRN